MSNSEERWHELQEKFEREIAHHENIVQNPNIAPVLKTQSERRLAELGVSPKDNFGSFYDEVKGMLSHD